LDVKPLSLTHSLHKVYIYIHILCIYTYIIYIYTYEVYINGP